MNTYEPPRVSFVGSDPKIPALKKAIDRVARVSVRRYALWDLRHAATARRFAALWKARNRRTRVLMRKVRAHNIAAESAQDVCDVS